ncbi:hypothetical protein [uncultured Parolsenella sp.]|uniref:hypothetical protein n=1 Tax=uncultured Parolsenella sp. TaxID=2083008 RepID=UPI0025CDB968|nr:hypothetical protein [uncultured Parolsenella sp.]
MSRENRDRDEFGEQSGRMRLANVPEVTEMGDALRAPRSGGAPSPSARKALYVALLVIVALVFAFPVADVMGSKETYRGSIEKLDAKAQTVTALVGTTTAASVAISAIPGDTGIPVADKLMDVAADFAIVLGAIYLEKYMLTIFGLAACRVVVPLACALGVGYVLVREDVTWRAGLRASAVKLALLALALTLVVPASVQVSNMIEETFEYDATSVSSETDAGGAADAGTAAAATESADAADDAQTSDGASSASSGEAPDASTDPIGAFAAWAGGLGEDIGSALSGAGTALSSGVTGILDTAKDWVARLIEAFAVMIVTNCVIPVVVLLFFVWIINVLMGLNIELPARPGASLLRRYRARG